MMNEAMIRALSSPKVGDATRRALAATAALVQTLVEKRQVEADLAEVRRRLRDLEIQEEMLVKREARDSEKVAQAVEALREQPPEEAEEG